MKLIPGSNEKLVTGIVTPCQWDLGNKITAVAIVTEDNEEFVVSCALSLRQLIPHLEKPVEAVGTVTASEEISSGGSFSMRAFRALPDDYLLEPEDNEWESEWDDEPGKKRQRRDVEDPPRHGRMSKMTKHKNKKNKEKENPA